MLQQFGEKANFHTLGCENDFMMAPLMTGLNCTSLRSVFLPKLKV